MQKFLMDERAEGPAQMVGVVIAGLVAIVVGVLVWYKINGGVTSGTGSTVAIRLLYNNTNTSASTVWALFPIVAIIVVAGVILAVVMGFGRSQA
jgi:hypothetical protein